ncbi:hypothetical protein [Gordonia sp. SMJS1]|uniref:hypothetical protein n=2 Tax=Gordonia TaxID=2053 RepID=UPI00245566B7|nr:hypothetical protein [Gordonia sp. SMJS1]WGJ87614.1 hypothetical protein QAD21_11360 [Gordonia sp. SMJS1]
MHTGGDRMRPAVCSISIRSRPQAIVLLLVAVLLSGCAFSSSDVTDRVTSTPAMTPADAIPPKLKIAFRWVPSPTLNLMSPEATFVRAYAESYELAFEGQSASWGYPGFESASPADIDQRVRTIESHSKYRDVEKTVFFTPLRRTEREGTVRVILCRSEITSTMLPSGTGDIEWKNFADSWGVPAILDFVTAGNNSPPGEQLGQNLTPTTSVFGSWNAINFVQLGLGPENRADIVACNALPPNPDLPRVGVETGPEPWPVLPPSPGWPANGV